MTQSFIVGVVGGACAGSEIAHQLQNLGMEVVVFEQGSLPYGKIEDGLPRWHKKLQQKEIDKIDEKLSQDGVHYLPNCAFGRDIHLEELMGDWGLPLLVLANGAWRDRQLRVKGAEDVLDHSLAYQNAFVYWFNHYPERSYQGESFTVPEGAVVIGGGLASIDVAKICQYELAKRAFEKHGVTLDAVAFDHHGIEKMAAKHGIDVAELAFEPAKLFYRKRIEDMPLVPLGENPDPKRLEKAKQIRVKLIENGGRKYGYEVYPLNSPTEIHTENGSVVGVTFRKNRYTGTGFEATDESKYIATNLVISSIGSIPQPLTGIPMQGELYETDSRHTGAIAGLPGVYCVGNAITGRGNIKESFKNAARLGSLIESHYLGTEPVFEKLFEVQREEAIEHVKILKAYLNTLKPMTESQRKRIRQRVQELQAARGCQSGFLDWRDRILKAR